LPHEKLPGNVIFRFLFETNKFRGLNWISSFLPEHPGIIAKVLVIKATSITLKMGGTVSLRRIFFIRIFSGSISCRAIFSAFGI